MKKWVLVLIVVIQSVLGSTLQADWPQWRGIHRDAVSPETGLLEQWPEAGPRVAWRIAAGAGYSSVSVAGDRLYTLWDEKDAQYLFCLDAQTGKEVWRLHLGKSFTNYYGNGPRSTPLIDDGTVYAVGTEGRLVAADRTTGAVRWQHDLKKEFAVELPSYGYSSSPLVAAGKLLIEAGGKHAAFMAFDKKSGAVAWKSETDRAAYSSPIRTEIDGIDQVIFWSAHGLHSVSPNDGKVLWRYAWETFCPASGDPLNTGTPIFLPPDRVYISSGSGAAVIRVTRTEGKFKVATVWESEEMRSDVNASVRLGHHIYGFDRGTLKCIDARTGEVAWKARGFGRGSLIAADGKLIVLGEGGDLALVDASPDAYAERGKVKLLEGRNWTAPSLAAGKLFLRNHQEIVSLDLEE